VEKNIEVVHRPIDDAEIEQLVSSQKMEVVK